MRRVLKYFFELLMNYKIYAELPIGEQQQQQICFTIIMRLKYKLEEAKQPFANFTNANLSASHLFVAGNCWF